MNPYASNQVDGATYENSTSQRSIGWFIFALLGVLTCVNVPLLLVAYMDKSWQALGIAVGIGPLSNGLVLFMGLACTPVVRRMGFKQIRTYLIAAVLLPAMFASALSFSIFMMELHGC